MSDELKPCPFCGSPAKLRENDNDRPDCYSQWWEAACKNKFCAVYMRASDREMAERRWNSRMFDAPAVPVETLRCAACLTFTVRGHCRNPTCRLYTLHTPDAGGEG